MKKVPFPNVSSGLAGYVAEKAPSRQTVIKLHPVIQAFAW